MENFSFGCAAAAGSRNENAAALQVMMLAGMESPSLAQLLPSLGGDLASIPNPPIYVKLGGTHLRLSYEGLIGLAVHEINKGPRSGSFLFFRTGRKRGLTVVFSTVQASCCPTRLERGSGPSRLV